MPCARKRSAGHSPPYRPEGQISRNSLLNSLLAGNFAGDGRNQHCIASQAVRLSFRYPGICRKGPPTAGFREFTLGLHLPIWPFWTGKSPKVSGRSRKYSRFQETAAGDLVRSRLPPEGGSGAAAVAVVRDAMPSGRPHCASIVARSRRRGDRMICLISLTWL